MKSERLRDPDRIPEAKCVEAAWTEDLFDFRFPVWSKKHNRAVSGIVRSDTGRRIFGAVYAIPSDLINRDQRRPGRKTLDQIEGEGTNYTRCRIRVVGVKSGQTIEAITYLPRESAWITPTDETYASYIREGLAEWDAPVDYVRYINDAIDRALARGIILE